MNEHPILWKVRTRWAAVGAAVAVVAGAGGIAVSGATNPQVTPSLSFITPCRIMDTRSSGTVGPRSTPLGTGETHTIQVTGKNGNCSVPSDVSGVLMNVTLVSPAQGGFITVFPAGALRPNASSLNYVAGQAPTPNQVPVALSASGQVSFYASTGPVQLIADIVGYASAPRMTPTDVAQRRWDKDRAKRLVTQVGPFPRDLLFDGTTLWVANSNAGTGENGSVSRVNPVTGVKNPTDVTVGVGPVALAFDGINVWVANEFNGTLSRINAATGVKVPTDVSVGSQPVAMAFDGTNMWVANKGDNTVMRVNASTGAVTATVVGFASPSALEFDGTYVWVANEATDKVVRINASTALKDTTDLTVGDAPTTLAFDGRFVWVGHATGVNQIDPVGPYAGPTTATGGAAAKLVYDGSSVRVLALTSGFSGEVKRLAPSGAVLPGSTGVGSTPAAALAFDGTNLWATTGGEAVERLPVG